MFSFHITWLLRLLLLLLFFLPFPAEGEGGLSGGSLIASALTMTASPLGNILRQETHCKKHREILRLASTYWSLDLGPRCGTRKHFGKDKTNQSRLEC